MKTTCACMHDACARMNIGKMVPLTITHPKHVPTPPKTTGFHLDPSPKKTQAFTSPKMNQNRRSKAKIENEKSLKNLPIRYVHHLKGGFVA